MGALRFRSGIWFRHRLVRLLVVGSVVGVVSGLAIGLAAGTRRTATAPDRYTSWAGGDPELQVVQLGGEPLAHAITEIPGVASASGSTFVTSFLRGPDGTLVFEPNPFAGDDRAGGARVVEGRFDNPRHADEFTVNRAMARLLQHRFGARVNDELDVASFDRAQLESNRAFSSGDPPAVPPFSARWVGTIESPADFETSAPAVYFPGRFLAAHPDVGIVQTTLRIRLVPGADPRAVVREIRSLPGGEGAFATTSRIVSTASRRAIRFQATALWIVTAIVLLGAAVVIMQLVGRSVRLGNSEARSLAAVGLRPRDLASERVVKAFAFAIVAVPVALLTAFWVGAPFPLGALDAFEPHPGASLDWTVALVGLTTMAGVTVVGALVAGRPEARDRVPVAARRHRARPPGGMLVTVAARFATVSPSGARRSPVSLIAAVVGMAGLVGAAIVALSLGTIVDSPPRWGVDFDRLLGNPFIEADTDIVTPVRVQPAVTRLAAVHLGSLTLDGHETPTLAFEPVKGGLRPLALSGRVPEQPNEISVGTEVASRLDVSVGDRVRATGSGRSSRTMQVVGIVVTPDSAGGGAAVTFDAYEALNPGATRNVLFADFAEHASPKVVRRIERDNFSPPDAMPTPTSVSALRRVVPAPVVLVVVLGVLLLIAAAFALTATVRSQRRDFAVLWALGTRRGQLRGIVQWQATLVGLAIIVPGVPLGVVLGHWIVQRLTDTLGIVPGVDVPIVLLASTAVGALLIANLVALVPADRAARTTVAPLNRDA
jgi:hypothetical protein